jgi:hypothetical protein
MIFSCKFNLIKNERGLGGMAQEGEHLTNRDPELEA